MIAEELKKIKNSRRELKNFGLVVGGAFLVLGLLFLWRGRNPRLWQAMVFVGAALALLGLAAPRTLRLIHKGWMSFAILLGWVMTNVILALFFYIILTPLALVMRIFGKRFLDLEFRSGRGSYWMPRAKRAPGRDELEKQF